MPPNKTLSASAADYYSFSSDEVGVVSVTDDPGKKECSVNNVNASDGGSAKPNELKRELSGMHLNFIAIGGTIGTGFFLGTGTALVNAGPAGCLISYMLVGTILWSVMVCMGEMATYIPTAGAFSAYATRFVDPSLGFAVGWLYWFSCEFRRVDLSGGLAEH